MYTIDELIAAKKTIARKRSLQFKTDSRHLRADVDLSIDLEDIAMILFLRKLIARPNEDFTVGLRLSSPNPFLDTSIVLLRYQGPHGGQSDSHSMANLHNDFHIHYYSQQDLDHRRKLAHTDEKRRAEFSSFEEAILCMLRDCNIEDPYDIFKEQRESVNAFRQIRMEFPE